MLLGISPELIPPPPGVPPLRNHAKQAKITLTSDYCGPSEENRRHIPWSRTDICMWRLSMGVHVLTDPSIGVFLKLVWLHIDGSHWFRWGLCPTPSMVFRSTGPEVLLGPGGPCRSHGPAATRDHHLRGHLAIRGSAGAPY